MCRKVNSFSDPLPLSVSSVQLLTYVQLFETPWTGAHETSLSITNSWSLHKLMSIESVMPSNHLIFCHPILLLPSIIPSIRVFSNESLLHIRWPKYWSLSFRYWIYFPVLYSGFLLIMHFIYSSMYVLTPISWFNPPPFPFGNHKLILYVCGPW